MLVAEYETVVGLDRSSGRYGWLVRWHGERIAQGWPQFDHAGDAAAEAARWIADYEAARFRKGGPA